MLRSLREALGYVMRAKDGDIGKVVDFYFDDKEWKIRYMVADTGEWLLSRKVLISPEAFSGEPDWVAREFPLSITKETVRKSPDVDTEKPVSRQKELDMAAYYNWPLYWTQTPVNPVPARLTREIIEKERKKLSEESDIHLRSFREVMKYKVKTEGEESGHITDFIVNAKGWEIRYLVADTGSWLPGRKVLLSPAWIVKVEWADSSVITDLSRNQLRESPEYNPSEPVNRAYEAKLYDYYGRPAYW